MAFMAPLMFGAAAAGSTAATAGLIGTAGSFALIPALQTAGTILGLSGAAQSASAQRQAGASADQAAQFRAAQLEQQAGQERASAQRQSIEARRRSNIAMSRAQALAASSGAGALDPTVINLMSGIAGEGELEANTALYQGEERAIGQEAGASASQYEGAQARRAGEIKAKSTILGGLANAGMSLSRYAPGPSPTSTYDANVRSSFTRQFGEF